MDYFAEILFITPFFYLLPLFVARALFGVKIERANFIAYVLSSGGSVLLVFWLLQNPEQIPLRFIISILLMLVMFLIYVKTDVVTFVFSFLLSAVILISCELCGYLISTRSFSGNYLLHLSDRTAALQYNLIPFLSSYIVVYMIYFAKKNGVSLKISQDREFGIAAVIMALIILLAAAVVLNAEMTSILHFSDPHIQIILVGISLLVLLTLSVCALFIRQTLREKKKNAEMEHAQRAMAELYDTTRIFRHNYKNSLIALRGYCEAGDMGALTEALDGLNQEVADSSLLEGIPDIVKIKDSGLRWLLLSKYMLAVNGSIAFSVLTDPEIDIRLLAKNDLHAILGILLDNAIDAAGASADKVISFSMIRAEGDVMVSLRNSVARKPEIAAIFDRNYSTKGSHEGLGLYGVKRILNKYDNVFLDVRATDSVFRIDINIQRGDLIVQ